jgi:hypothetical protein
VIGFNTYLDLTSVFFFEEDMEIQATVCRLLTLAIGYFANHNVSRLKAMAFDTCPHK